MLEHHIQREIVRRLTSVDRLRFSELKPADLENKSFDYHLKITIRDGYIKKLDDGRYKLTNEGMRMGTRIFKNPVTIANSAYSVLFLIVRRKEDGAWLLYKRNWHPIKDKVGFMHATPQADKAIHEIAADQCLEKTGLKCSFTALGGGFFRTYSQDLESFVNFTLLYCDDAEGELDQHDDAAEYFWDNAPDFSGSDMIPNMETLSDLFSAKKPFFVDKSFSI